MISINLAKELGITEDMDPDEINKRCLDAAKAIESNTASMIIKSVHSQ